MGVVTVKSTAITNRDATPRVANSTHIEGGMVRQCVATVAVATGDTSTSKYILAQLPSNARVSALKIYSEDCGSVTLADFGLWQTTENLGAVVDQDMFGSGISLKDGALVASDVNLESGVTLVSAVNAIEKRLWERAALTSDPVRMYDVVMVLTATADIGGQVSVVIEYVV